MSGTLRRTLIGLRLPASLLACPYLQSSLCMIRRGHAGGEIPGDFGIKRGMEHVLSGLASVTSHQPKEGLVSGKLREVVASDRLVHVSGEGGRGRG